MEPEDLASWRIFFKNSGFNIFTIIDNAIMVAANDYASHLRLRREQIISLLYQNSCSCKRHELSVPGEEIIVSQPNADRNITCGGNCCEGDSHQDKNGRVDDVGFNSVEQDKSVMVNCNDEKQMDKPADVEDGSRKELEAVGDADRNDGVEHQDQMLVQVPAKNIAVKQSGDSKLGSDGVSNINEGNVLESLDKNESDQPQDGLNKNTIVEESCGSKDVASNGISVDKDGALLENLNKINANQSGGSKEVSFNVDDICGGLCEDLYKSTAKIHHCGSDGNLLQMCGSEFEQTRGGKDLINIGDDTTKEVVEIKKVLENCKDQPNVRLVELLMKLESMNLDFKILKVTQIGKAVNAVRKYALKNGMEEIRGLACSLIRVWKRKVDEWINVNSATEEIHSSAKDQCPSGLLIEDIPVDLLAPTLDEALQAFDGLDDKEFFSILPQDNILGDFYTDGELGFTEAELLQIDSIPWKFDSSVSIRKEDPQQQPLPVQETSNIVEKQPLTDKNGLAISDDSKQVKKKGDTTKLGNQVPFQGVPESNENRKRKREENVVMKLNVASNLQIKPKELPKDRNAAKPEQRPPNPSFSKMPEYVRTSRSNEPREVERIRREPCERYRKVEDVKKQHAIQSLHVNHDRLNREYKRHKHHHAQSEKMSSHRESSGAKHSSQEGAVQRHPSSSSCRR